jgi:hypothetical protein
MRVGLLILVLVLVLGFGFKTWSRRQPNASSTRISASINGSQSPTSVATKVGTATKVDFAREVKPILEARCQPCHFPGGTMYQRLPFDQPKTIITLGTKLFTRLKDEKEQRLIREFLSQQSAAGAP